MGNRIADPRINGVELSSGCLGPWFGTLGLWFLRCRYSPPLVPIRSLAVVFSDFCGLAHLAMVWWWLKEWWIEGESWKVLIKLIGYIVVSGSWDHRGRLLKNRGGDLNRTDGLLNDGNGSVIGGGVPTTCNSGPTTWKSGSVVNQCWKKLDDIVKF